MVNAAVGPGWGENARAPSTSSGPPTSATGASTPFTSIRASARPPAAASLAAARTPRESPGASTGGTPGIAENAPPSCGAHTNGGISFAFRAASVACPAAAVIWAFDA